MPISSSRIVNASHACLLALVPVVLVFAACKKAATTPAP